MTIFLPAAAAAKLELGSEARIVLDPAPQYVIPATVSFVAADAQFTPKTVETKDERCAIATRYDKLARTFLAGVNLASAVILLN